MHNQVPYKPYLQLQDNEYRNRTGKNIVQDSIQCLNNNDFLLKYHNLSLQAQIRIIKAKGIVLNYKLYIDVRKGVKPAINTMWLGYWFQFWLDEYKYTFTFTEYKSVNFPEMFLNMVKPGNNLIASEPQIKYGL